MSNVIRAIKATLIISFNILLLLLMAELASRFFITSWSSQWQDRSKTWIHDEQLGWFQRPNSQANISHPQFKISVTTNSHGLRDKEYSLARTNKKRMLVLGDSFTWGYGVEAEQRFTDILEQRLPDWEIINAGVSGYGTDQELLYYQQYGKLFQPDVVLLLMYYNDYENNLYDEQYSYGKPVFKIENNELVLHNVPVPAPSWQQRWQRFIYQESYLLPRIAVVISLIEHWLLPPDEAPVLGFFGYNLSRPITSALVSSLNDEVIANNANLIVTSYYFGPHLQQRWLTTLAERDSFMYFPLEPHFYGDKADYTILEDAHWNAKGHKIAADAILQNLQNANIVAKTTP